MSDVSRLHAHAIFSALSTLAASPTSYSLFFGQVDVPDESLTYPYIVVWPSPGGHVLNALAGTATSYTSLTQVTAVGRNPDEVLAALDRAAGLLLGTRPDITGRSAGRIRQEPSTEPIRPDDTVHSPDGQPTYMGVAFYTLTSS